MEFKYAPMFQLGEDKTEYYKIPGSEKLVSTSEFEGKKILKVTPEALTLMTNTAFRDVSFLLRRSHNEQVAKILSDLPPQRRGCLKGQAASLSGHRNGHRARRERPAGLDGVRGRGSHLPRSL